MPPVVVAAGIGAVGALGGAALQSRASGRASDAQSKATAEALAFEKERDAQKRADYEKDLQRYEASRNILAQRYGISLPQVGGPAQVPPGGAVPRGAPRPPMARPGAPMMAGPPAGMMGQGAGTIASLVSQQPRPQQSIGGMLGGWNDWKQQGL